MSGTTELIMVAAVAVVTWIALFGYLMKVDSAIRRLERK